MENKITTRISCKESPMKLEERLEKRRLLRNRYCGQLRCLKRANAHESSYVCVCVYACENGIELKSEKPFWVFVFQLKVFNRIYHASFPAVCFSFDFWFYREITHFIIQRSTKRQKGAHMNILCTQAHNNTYMNPYHIQFDIYSMFGFRGQCVKWIA